MTEPNQPWGIRFDWTFNFGHILTIGALVFGGFLAWSNLNTQVSVIDQRTVDYALIRDQTKANVTQITALQTLIQAVGATNNTVAESVARIREDVAAIKATLNERK